MTEFNGFRYLNAYLNTKKKFESTVLSLIRLRVNFVKLVVPIISNFDRIFASSYYYYFDR